MLSELRKHSGLAGHRAMAEEEANALPLSVQIQSLSDRVAACAARMDFCGALLGVVRKYASEPLSETWYPILCKVEA